MRVNRVKVRRARHGAAATGPKIAALEYTRCLSCRRGVVYDGAAKGQPVCPHCGASVA